MPAALRLPALALALLAIGLLAWWPSLAALARPSADQVWEAFGLATACVADPPRLGWLGSAAVGPGGATLFASGLLGGVLPRLACQLARFTPLLPLQAFLVLGLALTALLAWGSCRWMGLRPDTSLLAAFLICTAPCSFSRVGHLSLALLTPVIPTLVACVQLRRSQFSPAARPLGLAVAGGLAALFTFPSQDYYVVFSVMVLVSSWALLLLISSGSSLDLAPLARQAGRGGLFIGGFLMVLLIVFLPKLTAAGLTGGGASAGVPASWSAPRLASEQFLYGLLPFTWLIPPPALSGTLEAIRAAGIATTTEAWSWSSGSLLIPIAWISAIRRLAQPPSQDPDRRFLALLLLLVTAIGLLVTTIGGLGTLVAVYVSPVMRSLNRFTAFVYGGALLYLIAEFDLWLQRRDLNA